MHFFRILRVVPAYVRWREISKDGDSWRENFNKNYRLSIPQSNLSHRQSYDSQKLWALANEGNDISK